MRKPKVGDKVISKGVEGEVIQVSGLARNTTGGSWNLNSRDDLVLVKFVDSWNSYHPGNWFVDWRCSSTKIITKRGVYLSNQGTEINV